MSSGPAHNGKAVTPDDSSEVSFHTRALWVGTAGDVRVTTFNGDDVTLKAVPAGTMLPVRVRKVWSTNTTAADLVALW